MKNYLSLIEKTNYYFFILFVFSATFATELFRACALAWLILWFLEGRWLKKSNFKCDKLTIPFLLFAGLWLYQLISMLWATNTMAVSGALERNIYFIVFLLPVFWGVNKNYKLHTIANTLIISGLVTSLIYFFTVFYITNLDYFFSEVKNVEDSKALLFPWTQYADFSSSFKHRLTHCTLLIMSIVFTAYMFKPWCKRYGKSLSILFTIINCSVSLFTIYLTGSRASLIAIPVLLILFLLYHFKKQRIFIWSAAAIIAIISVIVITNHPRMNNLDFNAISNVEQESFSQDNSTEPRLHIWRIALSNTDAYLPFGLGAGNARYFLTEQYIINNAPNPYIQHKAHAHNQYLETTMDLGIPGLILLIACLLSIYLVAKPKTKEYASYFIILIMLNLLTESMLNMSEGILIINLMMFILLMMNWAETKEIEQQQLLNTVEK